MALFLNHLPEDNIRIINRRLESELRKYQIRCIALQAENESLKRELEACKTNNSEQYKNTGKGETRWETDIK